MSDPIREYVLNMYPGSENWKRQVDGFSRDKVFAIYKRDLADKEQRQLEEETRLLPKKYPQDKLF
jgi:hypothetical protein